MTDTLPTASAASARAQGLLCPVCRIDLTLADRQGVEIDYCPQCRGIWLDRGELDKIIERNAAYEASVTAPQGGAGYAAPTPGYAQPSPWGYDDSHHDRGHHGGGHGGESRHGGGHHGDYRRGGFLAGLFRH
ncbi:hypothetical protein GCM10011380_36050 [Sphingomonas metalli]|uniref:Transcription factor zinc-finger domain-containing protein n=1 Tax=Sphingomonas metalli TaxID=1779358 RepID=A0A916TFX8_9SPHN|nr:zf-TFIIB domain-containing protein [Sphingomonas metalli]GGB43399.1 hypothetical protein GCM10011380_36050 [Sphingomonas metalli]